MVFYISKRTGSYDVTKPKLETKLYTERWWWMLTVITCITIGQVHFLSYSMVTKYVAQYYNQVSST